MRVLVTGANGFVGKALCERLETEEGFQVVRAVRKACGKTSVSVGDLHGNTDWGLALNDVDAVVHAAARVHMMKDPATDPAHIYKRVNVDGTLNLARQAALAGVRRFVFLSSIKVNGETTDLGRSFSPDDPPHPMDPYGISKWEAERGLWSLAASTGMEVVIIRPPLVYGPGVRANFQTMMRWLTYGIPLPLGAIHNRRSMVALDNLVDLLFTCLTHPAAANQTFLVSDGETLSTTELLRRLSQALRKPARLVPVPESLIRFGAAMFGGRDIARRLCGNLVVDITKTRQLLGWIPPMPVDIGLELAARAFLTTRLR